MAETTKISWTRSTWNPWIGCTKVSPGCDHCYASVSTPARALKIEWGPGKPRHRTSAANWRQPLRWDAQAEKSGERHLVFCSSLADVFDNEVPEEWRTDLFALIHSTPHLTWLLLTKRIGNVDAMTRDHWLFNWEGICGYSWPRHVWLGITVVNQAEAGRDVPRLLATPAAKRFVSYEPALEGVDWTPWLCANDLHRIDGGPRLDWVIVGGESDQPGMRARPFDVAWARSTVEQCKAAGVPVFMKQAGSFVVDRNDAGFDGCDPYSWPDGTDDKVIHDPFGIVERWQGATIRVKLNDRAGADPAEWPEDLRVREFA